MYVACGLRILLGIKAEGVGMSEKVQNQQDERSRPPVGDRVWERGFPRGSVRTEAPARRANDGQTSQEQQGKHILAPAGAQRGTPEVTSTGSS